MTSKQLNKLLRWAIIYDYIEIVRKVLAEDELTSIPWGDLIMQAHFRGYSAILELLLTDKRAISAGFHSLSRVYEVANRISIVR